MKFIAAKKAMLASFVAAGLTFSACGDGPTYVDNADSKAYSSMGLDYHDIETAAQGSLQSLKNSDYVQGIRGKKRLAISDIKNDTMQMVDVEQLSRKVTRELRNSAKFQIVSSFTGTGATADKMQDTSRAARDDDEFNQYTTIEKGTKLAPELGLSGKITQKNVKVGKKQRTDYYFLLVLTDLATTEVVWDDEVLITKVGSGKNVGW